MTTMHGLNRFGIIALVALLGLAPGLARAQRSYKVSIDSVPQGASIYLEAKEAGVQGTTPHTFDLKRGSYTFILEAEGYETFSRNVEVKRRSKFTFTLVRKPDPGTVKVTAAAGSSADGAEVKVNGKVVGRVPISLTLQQGRYLVEVVKAGHKPFSQWIDVRPAEKREIVVNLAQQDPGTGALLVSSNIMGAEVHVDGRRRDTAPALVTGLKPGQHMVELQAKGHVTARQEATVEAGKTVKVNVQLKPDQQTVAASGGTLMILASHKGVEILVDGTSRGLAPIKVMGLVEGSHVVEARKAGMTGAEQTVSVKKGEFQTIKLTLKEAVPPRRTGAIRIVSPVRGAQVLIDGVLQGKTPLLRHQLDPGPHFVTVRHKGYQELIKTVEVKAGQITELKAELVKAKAAPASQPAGKKQGQEEEQLPQDTHGLFPLAALGVAPTFFSADLSLGFPHIFEGRLITGFFSRRMFRLDGGVEFRTYGAMSEIGLKTRLRFVHLRPFSLSAFFALGGGGGPASRGTFYTKLGVLASLVFKKRVAFTGRAYFDFYSDRHCPEEPDSSELEVCGGGLADELKIKQEDLRNRFAGARLILSAMLEVEVHRHINIFGIFEGAPFQGNRLAFSDPFAEIMPETDPAIYGRAGVSLKY